MKWWCRCRLVEFELLMLTAVSTVWSQDVPRSRFIHSNGDGNEVTLLCEVVSLPVDVSLVI